MDATATSSKSEIESIERQRVSALVNGDHETTRRLHSDEYELVTPPGATLSKEQYLGAIAAGKIHYVAWDVESPIKVRVYPEIAMIRYQAVLELVVDGQAVPRDRYWHTDVYEKRDGRWQAVWSQATRIASA